MKFYNRAFQRIWDNIELVRRAIVRKFILSAAYKTQPFTSADLSNFSFFNKNDIIIGQNEIVTSDVVNRVINKLWSNVTTLLAMINTRDTVSTNLSLTSINGFTQTI